MTLVYSFLRKQHFRAHVESLATRFLTQYYYIQSSVYELLMRLLSDIMIFGMKEVARLRYLVETSD